MNVVQAPSLVSISMVRSIIRDSAVDAAITHVPVFPPRFARPDHADLAG